MPDFKVNIQSEIGRLRAVLLHSPGPEIERVTPSNIKQALYGDIINLDVAKREYELFSALLGKVTNTYKMDSLLEEILLVSRCKEELLNEICEKEGAIDLRDSLMTMSPSALAKILVEGGGPLAPLCNFYFMRDASFVLGSNALICNMANKVRMRESLIMEAIFKWNSHFEASVISTEFDDANFEGGDILVAREDILLVGNGIRTSIKGIESLAGRMAPQKGQGRRYVIVQELPSSPDSFIHLDMVFTLLDKDKCMAFEPVVFNGSYATILYTLEDGKVLQRREVANLVEALADLGMPLEAISCGGKEARNQEREQWHSGANFFAFAPGKVISYSRNVHTLEELSKHDFEIVKAEDVVFDKVDLWSKRRCVVTFEGTELVRGGGGARCMTLPIARDSVVW